MLAWTSQCTHDGPFAVVLLLRDYTRLQGIQRKAPLLVTIVATVPGFY